jgi:hypothetical protein
MATDNAQYRKVSMVSSGSGSRSVKWYPHGEEVEYQHVRLIARFEGFLGIRDPGP